MQKRMKYFTAYIHHGPFIPDSSYEPNIFTELLKREEFNDEFLYPKIILVLKIWAGLEIQQSEFVHMNPIVALLLKSLLEKKF